MKLIFLIFFGLVFIVVKIITRDKRKKVKEYWDNASILKSEINYCYDRDTKTWALNGISIYYRINGAKEKELNYLNNRLDGAQKYYNQKGEIEKIITYDFGLLIGEFIQS